ncbi:sugar phosphate nucleotidyltransferase [Acidithiobacillus ferrooxidans]|nr:sugar phosphate nucleotidyltransferase [Acidithiobacillus ferrooxidans]
MNPLIPVILSGGAGTRLWPLSRQSHPKPFLRLPDGERLLQKIRQQFGQFDWDKSDEQTWQVLAEAAED